MEKSALSAAEKIEHNRKVGSLRKVEAFRLDEKKFVALENPFGEVDWFSAMHQLVIQSWGCGPEPKNGDVVTVRTVYSVRRIVWPVRILLRA